ncbi:5-(carboxyamino)imidazole ribonucleotide synthase [Xylella fastidiosa subsp. multiplex]|uniref:5-(carboxyamino)imidazole ribonucleotide synthase n=1 Tax=Xylella fastidiosa TaxID=2371 RepID=UPI001BD6782F|nr:5-(carboxyamino)imidazole ribonucleotide synthase [Xylella fastidiosa]MBS9445133.1 5-(carboxyamino)imidazole ribonucleotide synthase [Xylella fastidiosa subsp. multiplex]
MKTLGILGGGQLARMLALAAPPLGVRVCTFDQTVDACAGQMTPLWVGCFDDVAALRDFVTRVDVITFDSENLPVASVQVLKEHVPVYPNPEVLAVAQDRLSEKTLFRDLGIPVPDFVAVDNRAALDVAIVKVGTPCILKTRRFGYDGKGQFRIKTLTDADAAWAMLGEQAGITGLILEAFVPFQREMSILAVRGCNGQFRSWPLTENWHVAGVLSVSLAPMAVDPTLQAAVEAYARLLAERLDYVGVFALELFVHDGRLLANEMAPRVHNSGHWTIEGAETSQFENHLRAVFGLPLGSTAMRGYACMVNCLGVMPDQQALLALSGLHWHDYGKQPRQGRKVGHATLRADQPADLMASLEQLGAVLGDQERVAVVLERLSEEVSRRDAVAASSSV